MVGRIVRSMLPKTMRFGMRVPAGEDGVADPVLHIDEEKVDVAHLNASYPFPCSTWIVAIGTLVFLSSKPCAISPEASRWSSRSAPG